MRLLDLFCGAGGAAMGYHRAGFDEIVGVDLASQPRYPFAFVQADALTYLAKHGHEFDAIHASPPCQRWAAGHNPYRQRYPDLIEPTRRMLGMFPAAWVIENVPRAPLRADYRICGCQVGLPRLRRVRWFEVSWSVDLRLAPPCYHPEQVLTVTGTGTPTGTWKALGRAVTIGEFRSAMGIDWMRRAELSEAIPPAYTEFIGTQLLESVMED
jgi:DNA (cytosine-5)-methyltransferase 1